MTRSIWLDRRTCDAVNATGAGRQCKRRATQEWRLIDGTVRRYCSAHANGAGVMRLLLPYPWEVRDVIAR